MKAKTLLNEINFGNSVAEFDKHLQAYFIETQFYSDFIKDRFDIISGDKGTGKTAIYQIVRDKYRTIPDLSNVELISGFNDSGNPVFQRLSQAQVLTEGQYITVWKTYLLSLLGNFVLDVCEGAYTENMSKLDRVLQSLNIRTKDPSAVTVFSQLTNLLKKFASPSAAEVSFSITEAGMPVVTPRIEFADITQQQVNSQKIVNSDDALNLLNQVVEDLGISIWLVLDRLDEAFVGFPEIEIPALRALFRTYLDMQAYGKLKLKIFVRNDLFRKIIRGGFVNLTHLNARRVQITWYTEDLYTLLCRRIRECTGLLTCLGLSRESSDDEIFSLIFPPQVDTGQKKPTTWNWILSRIRDGNNLMPPRNLIDLVNKAKEAQSRREERSPRDFNASIALIEPDAIRKGLNALSDQRVQDTLLAESGEYSQYIEAFRNAKAEHNKETLQKMLGIKVELCEEVVRELKALGFLETVGETYKIPMLYRSGLNVIQGKAFT